MTDHGTAQQSIAQGVLGIPINKLITVEVAGWELADEGVHAILH